ncbi:MAG: hypothetical protein ACMUJM_23070 [bacterium]
MNYLYLCLIASFIFFQNPLVRNELFIDINNDSAKEKIYLREDFWISGYPKSYRIIIENNNQKWQSRPFTLDKLFIAPISQKSQPDFILLLNRFTPKSPQPKKHVYLYSWRNGKLESVWEGSSFSKPIEDIIIKKSNDGIIYLYTLEQIDKDNYRIVKYNWTGFGFVGEIVETSSYEKIKQEFNKLNIDAYPYLLASNHYT